MHSKWYFLCPKVTPAKNTVSLWLENCLGEPDLALMIMRFDYCNTTHLEVKLLALKSLDASKIWLPACLLSVLGSNAYPCSTVWLKRTGHCIEVENWAFRRSIAITRLLYISVWGGNGAIGTPEMVFIFCQAWGTSIHANECWFNHSLLLMIGRCVLN